MKNINWTVRLKNKNFWLTLIPAVLLLVQMIADLFGFKLDLGVTGDKLIVVVDTVFVIMAALGIINDPTTAGMSDSDQAMTYTKPKE